ncbi:ABC transporter permease [Komagataeibacter oboediens]|uniref:ABC transporter permease n=1 Tax=Komagataeibacter oboediens TaxID=65958 RepID=A0ABS5SPA7_9PROT|nr:ABC transporter permease [Komagataeibacter oboediens]MBL7232680.1 ABC transporter permease [Komagataeibacter oboediens]MBT0676048.1 ABC transporter permease [Komagataeibacter oboediens]MBT0679611.1 ABC transporter permease [Komagataeibacter oboediens]MBV1824019.1 ABC transporter permease [Komagataeibacter oboediens]WEQ51644.1 ABC transporter permease [Komagataeibacter oboediens]
MNARNAARLGLLAPVLVGLCTLGIWQAACRLFAVPTYLFPAPSDIVASLYANGPMLLHALGSTLYVTLVSLLVSVLLGTAIAVVLVQHRLLQASFMPYVIILQVTPIAAVAPLIIVLVKTTSMALVLCATLIAIFPVISNTLIGLGSVDPGLEAYFRMHKATRMQMLLRLRIPSALPMFMAGVRIASGLALVGAVVAEFVAGTGGNSAGLAYEILQSGFQMDIPRMFAALFLITVTGLVLHGGMTTIERLLLGRWMRPVT